MYISLQTDCLPARQHYSSINIESSEKDSTRISRPLICVNLVGGFSVQRNSLRVALLHTSTLLVKDAEMTLCLNVPLVGDLAQQRSRLGVALFNDSAVRVEAAKVKLKH
jgi:hypothetical protein